MTITYLTPEILALVGEQTPGRHGIVSANDIAKFCAAIDEHNPLYLEAQAARAAGYADVIAPPLFNATSTRPVPHRAGLLADGQYDNVAPPGLGHLQTMLAGQRWEMIRPAVAGEEVVEVFTTKSITERKGSTGNILFIDKEATISTRDGDLIERYNNTLILRAPPPPQSPFAGSGAAQAPEREVKPATVMTPDGFIKNPDMVALFMFAAAIWAVHRIHYDVPYARAEGLPSAILPGWMLSSYLAQLAEMRTPKGQRLAKLDVRYKGMAHPGDTLDCRAVAKEGGAMALTITNQTGAEIASGEAAFVAVGG